jgi:hypothetical protein
MAGQPPVSSLGTFLFNRRFRLIHKARWQAHWNEMYGKGYKLAHGFGQDGNPVQVYEHHFHRERYCPSEGPFAQFLASDPG